MPFKLTGVVRAEPFPKTIYAFGFDAWRVQKTPLGKTSFVSVQARQKLVFNLSIAAAGADDLAFWKHGQVPKHSRANNALGLAAFIA